MKRKQVVCGFLLSLLAHPVSADIDPPQLSFVRTAAVSCYGKRIALESSKISDLVSFLNSVKGGWVSWGFITHPAGDIDIILSLKNNEEFWFYTWTDLRLMGTYGEKRPLSEVEAQQLKQLLPAKCFEPRALTRRST